MTEPGETSGRRAGATAAHVSTADPAVADLAVRTSGLTKVYGRQRAVDGVDLAVPRGSVYGFLGPNGSGKTTTIRMLLGLASPSAGDIELLGRPLPRDLGTVLPRVGALVEGPAFYPFLSGRANLRRLDAADPQTSPATRRHRVETALEQVGLGHAGDKRVHAYSLGMKQRLGLANALLRPRDLLVLDEPGNGLDPQGSREVRSLVRTLAEAGTTVLVSSHLLWEVEQMCSQVGVMSAGRLVWQGTMSDLRATGEARVRVRTPDIELARAGMLGLGLSPETVGPELLSAPLDGGVACEQVVAELVGSGVRVRGVEVGGETLEDRYVSLTGEGFDVAG